MYVVTINDGAAVPKPALPDIDDVQAIMGAGLEDVSWVLQEFAGVNLSDKRLDKRLITTAEKLASSPISPINEACGDWASTRAAYRLFDNGKASPKAILLPHTNETVKRMASYGGPVLAVQDTVFFSYGKHPQTRGIGPIGKSNASTDRGLIMHNAFAFTTDGVPLGILSQRTWARKDVPVETGAEKIERLAKTALDEKESSKWLLALRETVQRTPPGVKVVTLADRESDFFEFIAEADDLGASYVIRARTDRQLVAEDSEGFAKISEALEGIAAVGSMEVVIPSNGSRKARTATVEIRTAQVAIKPPTKRGKAKDTTSDTPVTINIVAATESTPPPGKEAITWVLLTNLPARNFAEAQEKVIWYGKRWGIETWHKVLKSGCKVEHCLLETGDRLKRFLALFSVVAYRLLHVTYFARVSPDAPSTDLFSDAEIETLHIRLKQRPPAACDPPPPLRKVVRMIGQLGGHLGRKCDGEPGATVLWRGLMRLHEGVETLREYKLMLLAEETS